jgi:hypothetical protein
MPAVACHCTIMPLLAAENPAKLSSSQLSRPTADVTVALEAVGEQMFTCIIYVLKLPPASSQAYM